MSYFEKLFAIFLHLDQYVNAWATEYGTTLYVILFLVIFCETGLVVMPFLPGDSLLFAVGALAANPTSPIRIEWMITILSIAAIVGDAVNYSIGYRIGPKIFKKEDSWILKKKHLLQAHAFYEKHGGKTIIFARFIPIVRTFAPFVAGIGQMTYLRFALFNVVGAIVWTSSFLLAGYWFGNREIVKNNFHLVIVAIIFFSILPGLIKWAQSFRKK